MSKPTPVAPVEADEFPLDSLRVVLVSPRNPLNIGAAARAMSNLGFTHLRVVNPYEVAFQNAKSAVNASYVLEQAEVFTNVADAVADCSLVVGTSAVGPRELQHPLRRLEYGGQLIRQHLAAGPAALLFGSEKYGLGNDDLSHCHWLMRIPTRRDHHSMNLGQSVAVCLYELIRSAEAASTQPVPSQPARAADIERITALLFEALEVSGYVKPKHDEGTSEKLRRMVRRMDLNAKDAEVWQGMVRQILWKLNSTPDR
jgi:TrmH family RNA methyltransferase